MTEPASRIGPLNPLYTPIGRLVISWSFVEVMLETWLVIIYQVGDGKKHTLTKEPGIPRAWSRKRDFLRHCFNIIDVLKPFAEKALPLLDRVAMVEGVRHRVIHSAISDIDHEKRLFLFAGMEINRELDRHEDSAEWLSIAQIDNASVECQSLASAMAQIGNSLLNTLVPEDKRADTLRRLGDQLG